MENRGDGNRAIEEQGVTLVAAFLSGAFVLLHIVQMSQCKCIGSCVMTVGCTVLPHRV